MAKEIVTNKTKKLRKYKKILIAAEVFAAMLVIAGCLIYFVPSVKLATIKFMAGNSFGRTVLGWFGKDAYEDNVQDKEFDSDKIVVNETVKKKLTGYKEILLIGIDSRGAEFDAGTNSDSMIVMHIDNDSGKVKMVSVYRDAYMEIIGKDGNSLGYYSKANNAYAVEGIQACINTLNTNMDLNISDYVILNFTGVTRVIDALGGIDVTLSQDEIYQLNQHLADTKLNTGLYAPNITTPGKHHLVGLQATTYLRIRKAAFTDPDTKEEIHDDYGRAARQQYVIKQLIESAKEAGLSQILEVADMILNANTDEARIIKTSMTYDEIMEMIPLVFDFNLDSGTGYPSKRDVSKVALDAGDAMIPMGVTYNVCVMQRFLYGTKDYTPSAKVQEISNSIAAQTGVEQLVYDPNETIEP